MVCVSVIVPVYNGEKTIGRCIESILNQTLTDIEIIVVNDGSVDGTLDVLRVFDDDRITVLSEQNAGQGAARNVGMKLAKGKYLSFVDADDIIAPEMLEKMYNAGKENNADIVQCGLRNIYPDGREYIQKECILDAVLEVKDRADYIDRYFTPCIHSRAIANKIFRRDFIADNNIEFGDNKRFFAEDLIFNMDTLKYMKRICFISEPYYNYMRTPESHSQSHKNDLEKLTKMNDLFRLEISSAPEDIKDAFKYTASIVSVYNIGACEGSDIGAARDLLKSKEFRGWLKAALKRKCTLKYRLLLTGMLLAPTGIAMKAAKLLYSR